MVTQVEIARRIGLDVSSVNKILNRRPGPVFRKETIQKVFRIARELGYDFGRIKFHHRRRHPRRPVKVDAEFAVYDSDGALHDQGSATIVDISLCGARVSKVHLPQGSIPSGPFTVKLRPRLKSLEDVELAGQVVRIFSNGGTDYGIRFTRLEDGHLKRLKKLADQPAPAKG